MISTREPQKLEKIPNTYWDITKYRPTYCTTPNDSDACCEATLCITCIPLIIPLWTVCSFAVTGKKMIKCCSACNNNKNTKTVTPITTQPKSSENTNTTKDSNISDSLK